ncbi:MAG: hypothetical protein CMJ65_03080 [Planctomycetaceae bacterium]|jgi:hypothetical protein|nr:hypothetical protein [Planctomycetaceae bacterium]MDP7277602.1 SxtJ family membrane protein [Planctomycetaceae bacterium]
MIEIDWNPKQRFLRQFAALFVLFFGAIGGVRFARGDQSTATVLWAISSLGLVGVAWPAFMRYIYVTWMALFFPVGWTVSMVILSAIYFLVVTPIGIIMRVCGHDRCGRRPDPTATTYWKPRQPPADATRYYRQF